MPELALTYLDEMGYQLDDVVAMSAEEREDDLAKFFDRVAAPVYQKLNEIKPYAYAVYGEEVYDAEVQVKSTDSSMIDVVAYITLNKALVNIDDFVKRSQWYVFEQVKPSE